MRFILQGLDCPACAGEIEERLRREEKFKDVTINYVTKSLDIDPRDRAEAEGVISRVKEGIRLVPAQETGSGKSNPANRNLLMILPALAFFILGFVLEGRLPGENYKWWRFSVFMAAYFIVGWKVILKAIRNILRGRFLDENFLMTLATSGAVVIEQAPEAAGVMLFFAVGEYFQDLAVNRSRRAIKNLMDIRPDYANLKVNGRIIRVPPEEVKKGETFIIRPGEKIPLDGEVLEGESWLDTSMLTGESVPKKIKAKESVMAGMVNISGLLTVKATRAFGESSVVKILQLVEEAASHKAPAEHFITRFARYYTPVVVFTAVAVALIPPLFLPGAGWMEWLRRSLVLLVISCPCALLVSIPLGYFAGIGSASRKGILVKGANFLDALHDVDVVVFDKTGTLTEGAFEVAEIVERGGIGKEEMLRLAACAEAHSNHPVAGSIRRAYGKPIDEENIAGYEEIRGYGVKAKVEGKIILAGNDRLLHKERIPHTRTECFIEGTVVYIAVDNVYAGYFIIADKIKPDARQTVAGLKELGISRQIVLSGDDRCVVQKICAEAGIDEYYAELLPEEKVFRLEEILKQVPPGKKLVFVGDGVNDAPVLMRADLGVAMGGLGSDAAVEAAEIVIMQDKPAKLITVISIARKTRRVVLQNIAFSLGIKAFFILLGVFGTASMWEAVFADVGVTLLAIFNAIRIFR